MTEATKKPRAKKPSASKATTTSKPRAKPVLMELPNSPLAFEVLDLVSRCKTKAKKVEALQKFGDISLKAVLIWNFDESITSALPDGDVPYGNPEDVVLYSGTLTDRLSDTNRRMFESSNFSLGAKEAGNKTTIRRQWKNLYNFVVGGNSGLSKNRRESMFINLLEGLHPLEAEILVLAKDKVISNSYKITQDVVAEAFPDIKWGNRA
jgi:hypothetical protein